MAIDALRALDEAPPAAGRILDLTPRELDVLACLARGRSNLGIAAELFLSVRTVECYVARIFAKLGLEQRTGEHRRVRAALLFLRGCPVGS